MCIGGQGVGALYSNWLKRDPAKLKRVLPAQPLTVGG